MQIKSNQSSVSTNAVANQSHEFVIGDVSAIIEILRHKLYSNPIGTLTQEYISNARDAHREAGNENPIKITLPTKIDSSLKIRDYGVGLDKKRVEEVFVRYGTSTKQSSNEQTGGFGLGAKSAWAYTDSFVVVSFYNGTKCTYVAHTGNNKNGVFELVEECETSEPNGVEVQIPVKEQDIDAFVRAVYKTTMFWEVKPELHGITDMEIREEYRQPEYTYNQDGMTLVKNTNFMQSVFSVSSYARKKLFVLVDGIPYDISKYSSCQGASSLVDVVRDDVMVFLHVDNGDVSVAASREEISNDNENMNKIEEICRNALVKITSYVEDSLSKDYESLKDYYEVYDNLYEMVVFRNFPNSAGFKFAYSLCEDCDFTFDLARSFTSSAFESIVSYKVKKKRIREYLSKDIRSSIHMEEDVVVVIKDGDISDNITSRKMRYLLTSHKHAYLITCKPEFVQQISDCLKAVNLSDLEYPKGYYNRSSGKVKEKDEVNIRRLYEDNTRYSSKCVKSEGIETVKIEEIEDSDETYIIVPFSKNEKYDYENSKFASMISFLSKMKGVSGVYKCGKKDYEKLEELFNVIPYDALLEEGSLEECFPIEESEIEQIYAGTYQNLMFTLKKNSEKIQCSKMQELFAEYPDERPKQDQSLSRFTNIISTHYADVYLKVKDKFDKLSKKQEEIFNDYPLLKNIGGWTDHRDIEEYVWYINGKYQSKFQQ
jgi:hypothetical protein